MLVEIKQIRLFNSRFYFHPISHWVPIIVVVIIIIIIIIIMRFISVKNP